jgi:hypothetical protein
MLEQRCGDVLAKGWKDTGQPRKTLGLHHY